MIIIIENILDKYERGDYFVDLRKYPVKEEFIENLDETVRLNNQRRDKLQNDYENSLKKLIQEKKDLHNLFISELYLTDEVSLLGISKNTVAKIWDYVCLNFNKDDAQNLFDEFENVLKLFDNKVVRNL